MKQNNQLLGFAQKLGKALMTPIAVLPAAAILLRLGSSDLLALPWMEAAGNAVFGNLAMIFAISIAISFAKNGNGVAAIAAGSEGVAAKADLLIVKLGTGRGAEGSSRTTELMRAVTWMLQKAQSLEMPLAVNISYGSTYGSHDGTSLFETFLNNVAESYKIVICVGSGNEGAAAGHTQVILDGRKIVECSMADYQSACNVSIWKNYGDSFLLEILSPGGGRLEIPLDRNGKRNFTLDGTTILFYGGEPAPYTKVQEYYFDFLGNPYITAGIWTFVLTPVRILQGAVSFYLPSAEALNRGTNFFRPTAAVTMTIPATAQKVITVGAYNPL